MTITTQEICKKCKAVVYHSSLHPAHTYGHIDGCSLEIVACDADCGAKEYPRTLAEYKATLEHYKTHSEAYGCSHGC